MSGPSRQLRRMQWVAIILVTAAIALNYMDRSTLAIGNLKIRQEFGISATAIGGLGSAWALTYGLAQLPSGYLLDRIGPKILVGAAMVAWSLCQAAGGLASSYYLLMLSRIGLGATEAPCFPSATRSVSDWFDVKHRGTPSGVYTSGAYIGPALAPPILTGVMLAYDWRVMFIVMGLAGIAAAGLWFMIYRDPRLQTLAPQDEEYLRPNREAKSAVSLRQWGSLFRFRAMWVLMLGGVLHRVYYVDVPDLAAGLPGNAAAHQHRQDRVPGIGAAAVRVFRRAVRGLHFGPSGQVRHGRDCRPPAAADPGGCWLRPPLPVGRGRQLSQPGHYLYSVSMFFIAVRRHLQMDPGDGGDTAGLLRLRRQQPELRRNFSAERCRRS